MTFGPTAVEETSYRPALSVERSVHIEPPQQPAVSQAQHTQRKVTIVQRGDPLPHGGNSVLDPLAPGSAPATTRNRTTDEPTPAPARQPKQQQKSRGSAPIPSSATGNASTSPPARPAAASPAQQSASPIRPSRAPRPAADGEIFSLNLAKSSGKLSFRDPFAPIDDFIAWLKLAGKSAYSWARAIVNGTGGNAALCLYYCLCFTQFGVEDDAWVREAKRKADLVKSAIASTLARIHQSNCTRLGVGTDSAVNSESDVYSLFFMATGVDMSQIVQPPPGPNVEPMPAYGIFDAYSWQFASRFQTGIKILGLSQRNINSGVARVPPHFVPHDTHDPRGSGIVFDSLGLLTSNGREASHIVSDGELYPHFHSMVYLDENGQHVTASRSNMSSVSYYIKDDEIHAYVNNYIDALVDASTHGSLFNYRSSTPAGADGFSHHEPNAIKLRRTVFADTASAFAHEEKAATIALLQKKILTGGNSSASQATSANSSGPILAVGVTCWSAFVVADDEVGTVETVIYEGTVKTIAKNRKTATVTFNDGQSHNISVASLALVKPSSGNFYNPGFQAAPQPTADTPPKPQAPAASSAPTSTDSDDLKSSSPAQAPSSSSTSAAPSAPGATQPSPRATINSSPGRAASGTPIDLATLFPARGKAVTDDGAQRPSSSSSPPSSPSNADGDAFGVVLSPRAALAARTRSYAEAAGAAPAPPSPGSRTTDLATMPTDTQAGSPGSMPPSTSSAAKTTTSAARYNLRNRPPMHNNGRAPDAGAGPRRMSAGVGPFPSVATSAQRSRASSFSGNLPAAAERTAASGPPLSDQGDRAGK